MKLLKLSIPECIITELLQYSNHYQIYKLWLKLHDQLDPFAFMINKPCPIDEILDFEEKCAKILKHSRYELPSPMRLCLLFADSIKFPAIFRRDMDEMDPLSVSIEPLRKWKPVSHHSISAFAENIADDTQWVLDNMSFCNVEGDSYNKDCHTDILNTYEWFNKGSSLYKYTYLIGRYQFQIDEDPDAYNSIFVYLNIKKNRLYTRTETRVSASEDEIASEFNSVESMFEEVFEFDMNDLVIYDSGYDATNICKQLLKYWDKTMCDRDGRIFQDLLQMILFNVDTQITQTSKDKAKNIVADYISDEKVERFVDVFMFRLRVI